MFHLTSQGVYDKTFLFICYNCFWRKQQHTHQFYTSFSTQVWSLLERRDIDHTMTATTEKMQFLILGNIPENVNLIYTKHTTDMYNIQIVYLLFINDYLHSCKTIGINEANKRSTDVMKNIKCYRTQPTFKCVIKFKTIFHNL